MLDAPNLTATVFFTSYRFRLLNMACDPDYTFTIAGHPMTVIEADGENTEPLTVDEIPIFAGQRYSFVVRSHLCCSPWKACGADQGMASWKRIGRSIITGSVPSRT